MDGGTKEKKEGKKKPGLQSSPELQAGEMHRLVLRITAERCLDHEKLKGVTGLGRNQMQSCTGQTHNEGCD